MGFFVLKFWERTGGQANLLLRLHGDTRQRRDLHVCLPRILGNRVGKVGVLLGLVGLLYRIVGNGTLL